MIIHSIDELIDIILQHKGDATNYILNEHNISIRYKLDKTKILYSFHSLKPPLNI